ncbi:hypothetical protein SLNSH_22735 [Alsobacter soli]|uniref:Uncharacterized protein n=1 Tax=Alsobacter soli TaxID=2109933 RepID=A0A2T1HM17_9HYPH|nr:hypothetical protein [Alsobacter soli]PSC02682.1 hypothetical protein SLNSH_22735 [Alsobacter soli]
MTHKFLKADGSFDLTAIMTEAWAVFRRFRSVRPDTTFATRLRHVWADAQKQRRIWKLDRAPLRPVARVERTQPTGFVAPELAAWIGRQCSTDLGLVA